MIKLFYLFVFLFFYTFQAHALWPNKYDWKKIETENFVTIVSKNHFAYGKKVSQKAEEAFQVLQRFSTKHPKKTYIIVDHTKNYTNGSATFFPYPIITLQPNAPSTYQTIGQYNEWLLELLIHEYTHILSFHNVGGIYRPLRWLLGTTIAPGYFMPVWYLEGLAVFNESAFTQGGRLRSSNYKGFKHSLTEDNMAFINEQETGDYPFGSTPYIYGSWLQHYTFTQTPKHSSPIEAASDLHHKFSRRLPFFVNSGYKASQKISAYKSLEESFPSEQKKEKVEDQGDFPRWSRYHKALFFIRQDEFQRDSVFKKSPGKKAVKLFTNRKIDFYKVTPKKIYFVSDDLEKQDHRVYNLRTYDFKTEKIKKISESLNIHNFDIYKNKLLFVRKSIDGQELMLTDLNNLKTDKRVIYKTIDMQERIDLPRFLGPNRVVFTSKLPDKKEQLLSYTLSNNEKNILTYEDHITALSVRGDAVFFIFENEEGKYLSRVGSSSRKKLPHRFLRMEVLNSNTMYFSSLSEKGPHIVRTSYDQLKNQTNKNRIQKQTASTKLPQAPPTKTTSVSQKASDYHSFTELAPHYIMPMLSVSPYGFSGEVLYGASTGGQDPLGLNQYSLSAFSDTISNQVSTDFSYTSNHFRVPIQLYLARLNQPLTYDITRTSLNASLGASYTFNFNLGRSLSLNWGAMWDETENLTPNTPNLLRGGGYFNIAYQNTLTQPRELAPEHGFKALLGSRYYAPIEEEYFDYINLKLGLRYYLKSPLISSHRLVFGIDGQWNDQDLPGILTPTSSTQLYRSASMGDFILRGVPTGSYFATKWFASGHLEYRFPLFNINWGPGLLPAFFQRVTGAFTADYASLKGLDLISGDQVREIKSDTSLYSAGAEIVIEGKAFYHVPASLQIGVYQFLNSEVYEGSPELFIGFGLTGF